MPDAAVVPVGQLPDQHQTSAPLPWSANEIFKTAAVRLRISAWNSGVNDRRECALFFSMLSITDILLGTQPLISDIRQSGSTHITLAYGAHRCGEEAPVPAMRTPCEDTVEGRFEFWRALVGRSFVPLDALPHDVPDFHAALCTAQVGAVQVSVVAADPHSVAHTRRHIASDLPDFVKLSLQLSGHCVLTQADRQTLLEPGELALYDTRHPYTLDFAQPYRMLVLMFPRAMLRLPERGLERMWATSVSCRSGLGSVVHPFLSGLAHQVEELESLGPPRLADNTVDLIGTLLAERLGADRVPEDDGRELLTRRILTYMDQRLADPGLGPDQVAAAHRISRRYLYKLLAEQGHTVSGWIRDRRLAQCRRDLVDPALAQLPVGAIGARWGFSDPAHFSHAFKSAYGISPREARLTHRPGDGAHARSGK